MVAIRTMKGNLFQKRSSPWEYPALELKFERGTAVALNFSVDNAHILRAVWQLGRAPMASCWTVVG